MLHPWAKIFYERCFRTLISIFMRKTRPAYFDSIHVSILILFKKIALSKRIMLSTTSEIWRVSPVNGFGKVEAVISNVNYFQNTLNTFRFGQLQVFTPQLNLFEQAIKKHCILTIKPTVNSAKTIETLKIWLLKSRNREKSRECTVDAELIPLQEDTKRTKGVSQIIFHLLHTQFKRPIMTT